MQPVDVPDQASPQPGLSPWARAASAALAETLFATEDGPPPPERIAWLCDDLDHFFAHAGFRARLSYYLCLLGVSLLAPLLLLRPPPFHALPRAMQAEALERLERHPLGLAFFGAKAILCIVYYEHPDAAREIGFDGACLRRAP